MEPGDHMQSVTGFASTWIEVDAADPLLAHVSKQALQMELAYAAFVGLTYVVVPGPRAPETAADYAQVISASLAHSPYMQLLVNLPLSEGDDELTTWDAWNTLRTICKYHPQLGLSKSPLYAVT